MSSNYQRQNATPDVIVETHQKHEPRQERGPNEDTSRMDQLARGLHPTVSPALRSLRQEQLFKSRKLKLTSFVNTKTQTWQGHSEGNKYTMGTTHGQDISADGHDGIENNEDVQFRSSTSGDIITIEESMSEAESLSVDLNNSIVSASSNTSSTSKRGLKKSRLAANFSGNEN